MSSDRHASKIMLASVKTAGLKSSLQVIKAFLNKTADYTLNNYNMLIQATNTHAGNYTELGNYVYSKIVE